jgi:hypothetical protein
MYHLPQASFLQAVHLPQPWYGSSCVKNVSPAASIIPAGSALAAALVRILFKDFAFDQLLLVQPPEQRCDERCGQRFCGQRRWLRPSAAVESGPLSAPTDLRL